MSKWFILIFFIGILNNPISVVFAKSIRFEDLKSLVEAQNERVQGMLNEVKGAEYREGALGRSFLPKLEIFTGQEHFKKGSLPIKDQPFFGAEVRVNLYNGGRDYLENEKRSAITRRKRYERVKTLSDELIRARETYWRILYLGDLAEILKDARESNSESLRSVHQRIRAGVGTEADRVEFEMQEIDLKHELERTGLQKESELRHLSVILGFNPEVEIVLSDQFSHEHNWENILKYTEEDHAFLVKPRELRAEESEIESRRQNRTWMPRLDAFMAYKQFNQREEPEFSSASERQEGVLGLRLSLPIFDRFSGQSEASALAEEAAALRAEANYAKREINAFLRGEISALKLLHDQVHKAEENIKLAKKYYDLTLGEYSRGVKNSPDVVGAMEKLVMIQRRRLEIILEFQIVKSRVLSRLGR